MRNRNSARITLDGGRVKGTNDWAFFATLTADGSAIEVANWQSYERALLDVDQVARDWGGLPVVDEVVT